MAVFTVLQAKWKVDVDSVCHPGGPKKCGLKKEFEKGYLELAPIRASKVVNSTPS